MSQESFDLDLLKKDLDNAAAADAAFSRFTPKAGVSYKLTNRRKAAREGKEIIQYQVTGTDGSVQWGSLSGLCQLYFTLSGPHPDNQRSSGFSAEVLAGGFHYVEADQAFTLGRKGATPAFGQQTFTSAAGNIFPLVPAKRLVLIPGQAPAPAPAN